MASTSGELFSAIDAGDVEELRRILDADPGSASTRDEFGVSALMRARYRSDDEAVAILRPLVELDLFEAAALGDVHRLDAILKEAPERVSDVSGDGFTPLHLAAFFGQADTVRALLGRGAEVDAHGLGWMTGTPLHSAASGAHGDIVDDLLAAGADPNARQSGGWTPLHSAADHGDARIADALLRAGADASATNDEGTSVLDLAIASGDARTIELVGAARA
jgi:ankyrin repeat protein